MPFLLIKVNEKDETNDWQERFMDLEHKRLLLNVGGVHHR